MKEKDRKAREPKGGAKSPDPIPPPIQLDTISVCAESEIRGGGARSHRSQGSGKDPYTHQNKNKMR